MAKWRGHKNQKTTTAIKHDGADGYCLISTEQYEANPDAYELYTGSIADHNPGETAEDVTNKEIERKSNARVKAQVDAASAAEGKPPSPQADAVKPAPTPQRGRPRKQ